MPTSLFHLIPFPYFGAAIPFGRRKWRSNARPKPPPAPPSRTRRRKKRRRSSPFCLTLPSSSSAPRIREFFKTKLKKGTKELMEFIWGKTFDGGIYFGGKYTYTVYEKYENVCI